MSGLVDREKTMSGFRRKERGAGLLSQPRADKYAVTLQQDEIVILNLIQDPGLHAPHYDALDPSIEFDRPSLG